MLYRLSIRIGINTLLCFTRNIQVYKSIHLSVHNVEGRYAQTNGGYQLLSVELSVYSSKN